MAGAKRRPKRGSARPISAHRDVNPETSVSTSTRRRQRGPQDQGLSAAIPLVSTPQKSGVHLKACKSIILIESVLSPILMHVLHSPLYSSHLNMTGSILND